MKGKPIPLVAQHESWISVDPIQGCPARCVYCYLGPQGLTQQLPAMPSGSTEFVYQSLLAYQFFEKSSFSAVPGGRCFPIAIGNYTDMCLTPKNRQYLLSLLQEHKQHLPMVPVCIVTKAVLDNVFLEAVSRIGITVIFFISLSFLPANFEKGVPPSANRLENFRRIAQFANLYAVHFWRPVTSLNVPDRTVAFQQIEALQEHGASVSVITGLKFGTNLERTFLDKEEHALQKFFISHVGQAHLPNEILEAEVQAAILNVAAERSYTVFLHTSCAVSHMLKQPDYNATFRKPHLTSRCLTSTCTPTQRERCSQFQSKFMSPSPTLLDQVAQYLHLSLQEVTYLEAQDVIMVGCVLTQEQQTFLTQATGFPVRGKALIPTLEWVGSINKEIGMRVSDMVQKTREVTDLFDQLVGRWNVHEMVTELTGEVGTLADSIMIQEKRRSPRPDSGPIDLDDDIVDIIFMLIRIADYYNVNLEIAYERMIDKTRQKLKERLKSPTAVESIEHSVAYMSQP